MNIVTLFLAFFVCRSGEIVLPANAIYAGSPAGCYRFEWNESRTGGTVYNERLTKDTGK